MGEGNVGQALLRRPQGEKSPVHLIGFLDASSVCSFLPAEIGFTWHGWKHFLLAGPRLTAHFVKFQQPCGEPSVLLQPGQASRPLSAYAPPYWPQMAVLTRIHKVHTMGPAVQFSSSVFLKPWIVWRSIVCVSVLWWAAAFNCHNRRRDDCTELTKANGIYSLPKPLQWQQIVFQVESSLWAFPNGPIRGEQRF